MPARPRMRLTVARLRSRARAIRQPLYRSQRKARTLYITREGAARGHRRGREDGSPRPSAPNSRYRRTHLAAVFVTLKLAAASFESAPAPQPSSPTALDYKPLVGHSDGSPFGLGLLLFRRITSFSKSDRMDSLLIHQTRSLLKKHLGCPRGKYETRNQSGFREASEATKADFQQAPRALYLNV